jgi:hypothetical protein
MVLPPPPLLSEPLLSFVSEAPPHAASVSASAAAIGADRRFDFRALPSDMIGKE